MIAVPVNRAATKVRAAVFGTPDFKIEIEAIALVPD